MTLLQKKNSIFHQYYVIHCFQGETMSSPLVNDYVVLLYKTMSSYFLTTEPDNVFWVTEGTSDRGVSVLSIYF